MKIIILQYDTAQFHKQLPMDLGNQPPPLSG